jgi:hypothetical protein
LNNHYGAHDTSAWGCFSALGEKIKKVSPDVKKPLLSLRPPVILADLVLGGTIGRVKKVYGGLNPPALNPITG